MNDTKFNSFKEFYPFYLSEHSKKSTKLSHMCGTILVVCILFYSIKNQDWSKLYYLPIAGYGFAWIGHFFFEKNKPATFKYPLYSFIGDWVMCKDIIIGKVKL